MDQKSEKEIFLEVLEIEDAADRKALIERRCEGDEELKKGVLNLLSSLEEEDPLDRERYDGLNEELLDLEGALASEANFIEQLGGGIRRLADYDLLEEIGRGAMGVVYRARQVSLNREVALKIVMNAALASEADRQRFRFEAEAAAKLSHPNLVPVYEIGSFKEHDFYSMEFVAAGTLKRLIGEESHSLHEIVESFLGVVDGVRVAHERGLIHRDLKPENILITSAGRMMVADFGLACWMDREQRLTLTGQLVGTPRYMAPEVATEGGEASTRSDVYALGAILYELLTGQPVFDGTSVLSTLKKVQEEDVTSMRVHRPSLPADLNTIVLKCLEKDPERRYSSARTLGEDLKAWLEHRPILARPPATFERLILWARRRPSQAALVGVGLLLLLLLGMGGPYVAYREGVLREEAEVSEKVAEASRRKAMDAAEEARQQVRENRRLAYAANLRYIDLAHQHKDPSALVGEALITGALPSGGEIDLRGWEWYFNLGKLSSKDKEFQIKGPVRSLQFEPSGKHVAASGPAGTTVRDGFSGALVRTISDGSKHQKSIWSPDGDTIVTLSEQGRIRFWSARDGRPRAVELGDPGVKDFSWGGSGVFAAVVDGALVCWKIDKGDKVHEIGRTSHEIEHLQRVAVSPDGTLVAGGGKDELWIWKVEDLSNPPEMYTGAEGNICRIEWGVRQDVIAAATETAWVRVWKVPGGERFVNIRCRSEYPIMDMSWNPDGNELAYLTYEDRNLQTFDFASGVVHTEIFDASLYPCALDWSARLHTQAVGIENGKVILKRSGFPEPERVLVKREGVPRLLTWSSDGGFITCFQRSPGRLFRTDVVTGKKVLGKAVPGLEAMHPSALEPETGSLVIVVQEDSVVSARVFEGSREAEITETTVPISDPVSVLWINKASYLVGGKQGDIVRVNDNRVGGLARFEKPSPGERHLYVEYSISPDRKHLLASGKEQILTIWSLETGKIVSSFGRQARSGAESSHAWHPDGRMFATAGSLGRLSFWQMGGKDAIRRIKAHRGAIKTMAWHPGGERLATAGEDGFIRLWDVQSGQLVTELNGSGGPIFDLAWDRAGHRLASCGESGDIWIYDATAGLMSELE